MRRITSWYLGLNIYFKLLPLLLLYFIIIILWVLPTSLSGDEGRYIMFANNLLNGFYSPTYPDINLWNGPGYPLFITPFIFLKTPILLIRLINGILLYFSLIFSYKTILIYSKKNIALIFTIFSGLYFPTFQMLRYVHTETLSWFLISVFCFYFVKLIKHSGISWKYLLLSSISIFYLAMVKVIFGYVIITMLFLSIIIYFFSKIKFKAIKSIFVFFISLVFCIPYLFYTYKLTNKPLYWTNAANMSLYTMSTPYTDELGDWSSYPELLLNPNHKVFMDSIGTLSPLEKDHAFKTAAIENIKKHPTKYLYNYIANVGRLFFEYPFSNKKEDVKTLFYIFPSMFPIVFIAIALLLGLMRIRLIPTEIIILLLFILSYLFGSTIVSTYSRMFNITLPFWVLFLSFVYNKLLYIKFK